MDDREEKLQGESPAQMMTSQRSKHLLGALDSKI